ncbi:hypothetical protein D9758_001593 [Tetrapyrgos nigripes]|uniref:Uncharacterized protein n=1 Tax=Tetrapyrgos nigripes TaxID=182062 RepID=A0A8H5LXC6_9AGAR|nr:hypothetical protein D9758_001593 [Tetrapyrgos nigripes]
MHTKRHPARNFIIIPGTFILILLIQRLFFGGYTSQLQASAPPSILHIEGQWKQVRQALGLPPLQDAVYFSSTTYKPNRSSLGSRFFKLHSGIGLAKRDSDDFQVEPDSSSNPNQETDKADIEPAFTFAPPPTLYFPQDALHEPRLSTEQLLRSFQLIAVKEEHEDRTDMVVVPNSELAATGNRPKTGAARKSGRSGRTIP